MLGELAKTNPRAEAKKGRWQKSEATQEQTRTDWKSSSGSTATKAEGDWMQAWNHLKETPKEDAVMKETPQEGGVVASASSAATYVGHGGGAEVAAPPMDDGDHEWEEVMPEPKDPNVWSLYAVPNPWLTPSQMGCIRVRAPVTRT